MKQSMTNILSVLILNRNNSDDVIRIYNELKKQTFQDFHVIVIDDNSEQIQFEKLSELTEEKFILYSYPSPWKFGNDNKWNMGLRKAYASGSRYTYSIQTDMKINSENLLYELVNFMERNQNYGAVSPTIFDKSGVMTWGPGIEKTRMGKSYNINETFITRNSVMHEINYIHEKLIYFGSEFYFNNKMKSLGYETAPLGGISVMHFGGGTSSKSQLCKHYYRPRTTILILKIFNKQEGLYKNLKYFFQETAEIRNHILDLFKNFKFLAAMKVSTVFITGILSGLFITVD